MNRSKARPNIAARAAWIAGGQRGFSAIEVTAVAAIIFIMALILIPIVNKRVEESKIKAAMDDMVAIEKAEQMAFGYTGHYYRLCDLSRNEPNPGDDKKLYNAPALVPSLASVKVPMAYWNKPITRDTETIYLVNNWKGPYLPPLATERSLSLADLSTLRPELCNGSPLPNNANVLGGPIFLFALDDVDEHHPPNSSSGTGQGFIDRRYPIDPWGNPYLFFGPGYYGSEAGQLALDVQQASYDNCVVYSTGPDGAVSDATTRQLGGVSPTAPQYFFREHNLLGTGDDLKREF